MNQFELCKAYLNSHNKPEKIQRLHFVQPLSQGRLGWRESRSAEIINDILTM